MYALMPASHYYERDDARSTFLSVGHQRDALSFIEEPFDTTQLIFPFTYNPPSPL